MAEPRGYFTDGFAENTPVHWLIDTGSTTTILSQQKYLEIPAEERPDLQTEEKELVTADDKPLKVFGRTTLNIKFGTQWVRHEVYVAEISNQGLIGVDFLLQHKVSLDFAEQKITFHGENFKAQCTTIQERTCRISVSEGIMIPAGTRKII